MVIDKYSFYLKRYGLSDEIIDLGDAKASVAKYWYHPQHRLHFFMFSLASLAFSVFKNSMNDPSVKL